MREIGGFFELECDRRPLYYQDGIYLNSCRSALRYIIRTLGIKSIYAPFYTCNVVYDAIQQEGCKIVSYGLDSSLLPTREFSVDDFIIYNNYFGVIGENVGELASRYPNLIVDNAQAFYSMPDCRASIYSPRKFFGLPDGGILRANNLPLMDLEQGCSSDVVSHLFKRYDYGARNSYHDFCMNDKALEQYTLQRMSKLTTALMGNIDYDYARKRRLANFHYLEKHLFTSFPLKMTNEDVPLVFPLLVDNGEHLRENLIKNNIFCARYWPNILESIGNLSVERNLALNLVAVPIDQRYDLSDMEKVVRLIKAYC